MTWAFQKNPTGLVLAGLSVVAVALISTCSSAPGSRTEPAGAVAVVSRASGVMGRVIGVTDGDTLTLLVDGRQQTTVRLAEIDAPERGQPWGDRSRQALSDLVFERQVVFEQTTEDRWGRSVGRVAVGGRDVGRMMIADGAAWAYRAYLTDESLIEVEETAQRERRGLWSLSPSERIAPWAWRRGERVSPVEQTGQGAGASLAILGSVAKNDVRCGSKTRCSQMSSCDEARAYLHQCRVDSLDADGDGRPCETLCSSGVR